MQSILVEHITKKFGTQMAVNDVSFAVESGEIFGLLGPNGAGKTTTIRIILDIFKPDAGKVAVLGGAMTEEKKARVGYLPEDRGLYQDIPHERCLVYLATLKGLSVSESRQRIDEFLERFDLADHKRKKIKELSKGMQQKAQLISTLVHRPDVIIIDEPFSGLDPVNTQMIKDLLVEERNRGVTIVMSTHQMHQVEELCDRLLLIHQAVLVGSHGPLPETIAGTDGRQNLNGVTKLMLSPGSTPQDVLRSLVSQNIQVEQFEIAIPTLDEIFIKIVKGTGMVE